MKLFEYMRTYFLRLSIIAILFAMSFTANASQSFKLYVGQSTFVSCPDAPTGAIYQTAWGSRHAAVSVTKDGTYGAKIKVTSYFTGTAQVQCDYYWRWYVGNRQYTNHATTYYNVTCEKVNIRMNQSGPVTLNSGDGINLSVTLSPSITPAPTVIWNSSNTNIAEVNQNGYVWARQPGTAIISASSNAGPDKATITINVNSVSAERAELSPSTVNIVTDETKQLTLTTYPQYSKAETASWYSRNPSIASVNSNGTVTGKSTGSTSVYCVVNGYINTNDVRVNVSKPKLTLSADKPSGLYEKGTLVTLSSSKYGSDIYYALDGSTPNKKSKKYAAPIRLDNTAVLKAFAVKEGCINSDVLSIEYKVSSLKVSGTYPEKDAEVQRVNVVPTVMFSDNIQLVNEGNGISLKSNNNSEIKGRVVITGNSLSFVPDNNLKEGNYTFTIPQQTVISSCEEENFAYSYSFGIKGSNIITDICAAFQFSQVLKGDGTLWAWGRNDVGNIGNGASYDVNPPVKILENIVYSEACGLTSAAINESGELYMWGKNNYGQLGNKSVKDSSKPIHILNGIMKVVTSGDHTLALDDMGYLYSWGANWSGELGIGKQTQYEWTPWWNVTNNVKDMAASDGLTLIVTKDDELYTCGSGLYGQLGNGAPIKFYLTPHKVMDNVKKVAALRGTSIVLKNDGTVWSFGDNKWCQLGVKDDMEYSYQPLKILSDVKDIDANYLTVAAIKTDNSLWLWGTNFYGQIGNGTRKDQKTPTKILDNVKKVSVGENHVLALTTDGELYGWGDNACYEITERETDVSSILSPVLSSFFPSPIVSKSLHLEDMDLKLGEQGVLLPSISPANAGYMQIEWNSSNPDIASVSEFGVVTGISVGRTTISCRIYNAAETYIEATCQVTVSDAGNVEDSFTILLASTTPDGAEGWVLNHGKLTNVLTKVWEWRSFNGMYYLNASAYVNGMAYESNGWAISPVIKLNSSAKSISFEHAAKFQSTLMEMCSVNIRVHGNSDWTKLEIPNWPSAGSWTFLNSGDIDIAAFAGKEVEIGINYTSDYRGADTWEIHNLVVPGVISENNQSGIVSIGNLNNQDEPIYYNLQGIRMEGPGKGVYIKTQNGKTLKFHK